MADVNPPVDDPAVDDPLVYEPLFPFADPPSHKFTRTFVSRSLSHPNYQKKVPQQWVRLPLKLDWADIIGERGAALVVNLKRFGENVYHPQHRKKCPRTISVFRVRDAKDRVIGGGIPGEAELVLEATMHPIDMDFQMLVDFLPALAKKIHTGSVQFYKEDYHHLACLAEAFGFARGWSDWTEGIKNFFWKLFLTGSLSPAQVCHFANFLLKLGIPKDLYRTLAVPLEIDMLSFRHAYRTELTPGYQHGIKEYWYEAAHHIAAFLAPLLMRQRVDEVVELLVLSGNPAVARAIRLDVDEYHYWSNTLRGTIRYLSEEIGSSIRQTKYRLHFMTLPIGSPHPKKKGKVVREYTIADPFGCLRDDGRVIKLNQASMAIHSATVHAADIGRPCPDCGVKLPIETAVSGPIWKELSYLNHSPFCPKLSPPYSTRNRAVRQYRDLKAGNCYEVPLSYPFLSTGDEFPDVEIDYLMVGNAPSRVVFGYKLVVRTHTEYEEELYQGIINGTMDPDLDLRPVLTAFPEDLYD